MGEEKKEPTGSGDNVFFEMVERLALNPDVDVDKLQRVMDIYTKTTERNAKQAFNADMVKVQSKIELVLAKEKNVQTHSTYADLKAILLATKPIYTEGGFSLMFYEGETRKENHKRVCVDIMHKGGHTENKYVDMAVQTKGIAGSTMMTEIHGEASAFMYGRRHLTCMIFNIPTGGDDDGNEAGATKHIDNKQKAKIEKLIKEKKVDIGKFKSYMEVESLDLILGSDYEKAISALNAKETPKG